LHTDTAAGILIEIALSPGKVLQPLAFESKRVDLETGRLDR
jgi:hypothetical protein